MSLTIGKFRLYDKLEEYTNLAGVKFQLGFWEEGLAEYVQSETKREIKDKENKQKLRDDAKKKN